LGLPLLLLDIPLSSKLEADLIAALWKRAPSVFATAARGDERTIEFLKHALDCKTIASADSNQTNSLSSVKRHLFENSKPDKSELDESVVLTSWPGEARECVEI